MQRNFFLIESYDGKLNEWRIETGFVFDTLEEAEQTLFACQHLTITKRRGNIEL